jgi:Zn-dependent protease with chaperone function
LRSFSARYYDGQSSAAREVRVGVDAAGRVHVHGDGVERRLAADAVRVSERLGHSPRYLYLPDGATCETDDHAAVDAALGRGRGGWLHTLEARWGVALGAALITAACLWAAVQHGLPALARHAAHALPPAMELEMGRQALQALDAHLLAPSGLPAAERARVQAAFARVSEGLALEQPVRLELRAGESIGANAMALPSGIVIVTDDMARLASNDEELIGVMAHELGHVHHRHVLRALLQSSATALLVATLLGDVTSVTALAGSIPTFLVEQHYSRAFEREADAYAVAWMRSSGLGTRHYARMLERLAETHGDSEGATRYLSSHPSIRERVQAIEGR